MVLVRRMVAIRGDWLQERSEPWGRRSQPGRKLNEQRSNGTVLIASTEKPHIIGDKRSMRPRRRKFDNIVVTDFTNQPLALFVRDRSG